MINSFSTLPAVTSISSDQQGTQGTGSFVGQDFGDLSDLSIGTILPLLTRRQEEDRLSEHQYSKLPFPESQLVSLAHSLIARGVINEAELVNRMAAVRTRLESCT